MIIITGLEYLIRENKIRPKDLAKEMKVRESIVLAWIKGVRKIDKKHLEYLAKKFNADEGFIINKFQIEFKKVSQKSGGVEASREHKIDTIMNNIDAIASMMKKK